MPLAPGENIQKIEALKWKHRQVGFHLFGLPDRFGLAAYSAETEYDIFRSKDSL
jgi:hypothetical protein